jgi:hypothetical protein
MAATRAQGTRGCGIYRLEGCVAAKLPLIRTPLFSVRIAATGFPMRSWRWTWGDQGITVTCSNCGAVQTLPGFLHVEMFVCQGCGETVEVGGGQVQ